MLCVLRTSPYRNNLSANVYKKVVEVCRGNVVFSFRFTYKIWDAVTGASISQNERKNKRCSLGSCEYFECLRVQKLASWKRRQNDRRWATGSTTALWLHTVLYVEICTASVSPADSSDFRSASASAADGSGTPAGYENDDECDSSASSVTATSSIPLPPLPPMEASRETEAIGWEELTWYDECEVVNYMDASRGARCVTAMPATGSVPGHKVLVLCQLVSNHRVSREVVCRRVVRQIEGTVEGNEYRVAKAPQVEEAVARRGSVRLHVCHLKLRQTVEYLLSYGDDTKRGAHYEPVLELSRGRQKTPPPCPGARSRHRAPLSAPPPTAPTPAATVAHVLGSSRQGGWYSPVSLSET